jgi:hypothetical protein
MYFPLAILQKWFLYVQVLYINLIQTILHEVPAICKTSIYYLELNLFFD